MPSAASSSVNGVALAQACGAQANRIERRATPLLTPEAAEQFRQPTQIHVGRRVEQPFEEMRH